MAFRVDVEPKEQPQTSPQKRPEKSPWWLKVIPPSLIAPVVLGACQLKPIESQVPSSPTTPAAGETLPVEGTPVNFSITPVSFKNGYPQEFSSYADALGSAAKKDGVDLKVLPDGSWIKAEGPKGKVDYALVPFATVTGLTDPDGIPSDSKPVYYLAYPDNQGNVQSGYVVGKLIETDEKGRVSFTARMIDSSVFESWKNSTQAPQTKLGQIIYAIPLKEGITVEQARQIQKDFIEGKITQEQLLSQYAIGISFIQPEKPDNFVSIAISAGQPATPEPGLLEQAFNKLLGATPAAAAGLEYSATPAPEPTPVPTIEVNGLQLPDPHITNPELFDLQKQEAPIPQFVNALKNAGIEVSPEQIAQGITFVSTKEDGTPLVDKDGNPFVVAVYNLDPSLFPEQYRDLAGPVPLMIATKGENGWGWSNATNRLCGKKSDILTGAFFGGNNLGPGDFEKILNIIKNEFSLGGIWIGMSDLQPNENQFKLTNLSLYKNVENSLYHPLIWFDSAPDWIRSKDNNQLKRSLIEHVRKISSEIEKNAKRSGGSSIIVVVNEARHPRDFYYQKLGDSYIEEAFRTARESSPSSILIYNDYNNHTLNGERYRNTLEIVNKLKALNLIDGVGIQLVIDGSNPPTKQDVIDALRSYGVNVYITEFSVNMRNVSGSQEERIMRQAKIYHDMTRACVESGVCKAFVDFQIGDKFSVWENNQYLPGYSSNADPTPYDDNLNPKLALYFQRAAFLP